MADIFKVGQGTGTFAVDVTAGVASIKIAGVKISGVQQAAEASFTFGTNVTAATADSVLTDSAAVNPTAAQFDTLSKDLGTKINSILTKLRAHGIIAA